MGPDGCVAASDRNLAGCGISRTCWGHAVGARTRAVGARTRAAGIDGRPAVFLAFVRAPRWQRYSVVPADPAFVPLGTDAGLHVAQGGNQVAYLLCYLRAVPTGPTSSVPQSCVGARRRRQILRCGQYPPSKAWEAQYGDPCPVLDVPQCVLHQERWRRQMDWSSKHL